MSEKPAQERAEFERWKASLPKCAGYEGACDGDLEGEEHEPHCPLFQKEFATLSDAWTACWQAATLAERESAAKIAEEMYPNDDYNKAGMQIAKEIRKGGL